MTWTNDFISLELSSTQTLPPLVLTHLASWTTIHLVGQDKKSYLHGQVTCDVVSLTEDQSTLGAHCDAKGKMWSIFRLFHHNQGYSLFQPLSAVEAELRELKKYAVFSKVEITQSEDICFGLIGEQANSYIDQISEQNTGDVRSIPGGTAVKLSDQRWLLVIAIDHAATFVDQFSELKCEESLWHLMDILEGIPSIEQSEQNQHIPQAMNLQALEGISFTKGCYTGQETVARAKYRGINKRAMYRVSGPINEKKEGLLELERAVGENWRTVGTLLSQYEFSNHEATGLIILPNDLDPDTKLRLLGSDNAIWSIETLPYSLD